MHWINIFIRRTDNPFSRECYAVQDIMQIIREQELMNDALGRVYGEDLHVIRNRIKELNK